MVRYRADMPKPSSGGTSKGKSGSAKVGNLQAIKHDIGRPRPGRGGRPGRPSRPGRPGRPSRPGRGGGVGGGRRLSEQLKLLQKKYKSSGNKEMNALKWAKKKAQLKAGGRPGRPSFGPRGKPRRPRRPVRGRPVRNRPVRNRPVRRRIRRRTNRRK